MKTIRRNYHRTLERLWQALAKPFHRIGRYCTDRALYHNIVREDSDEEIQEKLKWLETLRK